MLTLCRILCALLLISSGTVFAQAYPGREWTIVDPAAVGMNRQRLIDARDYALTGGGAGMITRHGKAVLQWGDTKQKFDLKSTSKSIGVTALGLAVADRKMELDQRASTYHPSLGVPPEQNARNGWTDEITVRHLAAQTAGFAKRGGYERLLFRPGTAWHYSDGGPNWLAECVTLVYRRDIEELMFERVLGPIGITAKDLHWRKHAYRSAEIDGIARREFGSGVHANVDAMARIGLLYLREGKWNDRQLIPAEFVNIARVPANSSELPEFDGAADGNRQWSNEHGDASAHYGLLWWNNADGSLENVPRDAYWSWGLYDSLIVVIPSLDIVVSRAGKSWNREPGAAHYEVLRPFLDPIVASVQSESDTSDAPYPASEFVTGVRWAPSDSILRLAEGSDNWPITWADDGHLYTAYGDGWGFEPRVEKKLSLGLARISGLPPDISGHNIRSPFEQLGQGPHGRKASGMLCVDSTLYMWVRNADNSKLAWSSDHGQNWQWAEWKFEESFGSPTFVNFGPSYRDARDEFVYVVSSDSDSAYEPADRFVMARVHRDQLLDRDAYQFFQGATGNSARWSTDIADRGAVFVHPGNCYRSGITFNAGLGRYLWCQVLPQSRDRRGPRYEGGFGIYESPEPWGPWRTVHFTKHWDVGPGETSCFPTKWMSDDGRTAHLLFSGDDCFSVRRAKFEVSSNE